MRRSSFLQLVMAATTGIGMPFSTFARRRFTPAAKPENSAVPDPAAAAKRIDKGFFVSAGQDRFAKSISLYEGDTFYTKVSTSDTNGDLYIYESSRIKEGGPPLHVHFDQDECWYVLQGEFMIKVGDQLFNVKAGDTVFGPRGVPHAFAKVGAGEGRLLMTFQPAGRMEEFFIAMSKGVTKDMTPEQNKEFRKEHGFEVVGPALAHLKQ